MHKILHLKEIFGPGALEVCRALGKSGFEAVLVGGAVRDALHAQMQQPGSRVHLEDTDIATRATPQEVREVFRAHGFRTFSLGRAEAHGTIGVLDSDGTAHEVTTYRHDVETDGRHARISFAQTLEEDLLRRDYTANALACLPDPKEDWGVVIDPFGGLQDIEHGLIRAVGDPDERFREDRLRPIRGYRFAARFGWDIEPATRAAMARSAPHTATRVSVERFREEMLKLARQANEPGRFAQAVRWMDEDGLLAVFLPEVSAARGVDQGGLHHAYDVFTHLVLAADEAGFISLQDAKTVSPADRRAWSEEEGEKQALFRFAALLHDIGKPGTRKVEEGKVSFIGHDALGASMAREVMGRIRASRAQTEWVVELIDHHMKLLDLSRGGMSDKTLRKLRSKLEHISLRDLLALRVADKKAGGRVHSQVPLEQVERMNEQIDALENAPMRVSDLALGGLEIRSALSLQAADRGWEIGAVQRVLLEMVLEDPSLNEAERLHEILHEVHAEALRRGPQRKAVPAR